MFTPQLLHAYKTSGSKLPLSTWIGAVAKNLPSFKNDADIFMPIRMKIKLAGNLNTSNGNVSVSVSPFDANWYPTLVSALEEMTGKRDIKVVDYLGAPVETMSTSQLINVGECDVVDCATNKPIRLESIVPPPDHLSTNKVAQLKDWWTKNQGELAANVANSLRGKSMAEISQSAKVDGSIQSTIETFLQANTLNGMDWSDFVRTYGKGDVTVADLASKLLDKIRAGLVANETQIRNFHATEHLGSEAALWKRNTGVTKYKDDFTLYRDIVEDAVCHPMAAQQVVQSIMCGRRMGGGGAKKKQMRQKQRNYGGGGDGSHPISSYYKLHHYPVHGNLPSHVMERNFGKIDSAYPGDHQRAIDMFNLFSGRSVIGCGVCGKKKKKSKDTDIVKGWMRKNPKEEEEISSQLPINDELIEGNWGKGKKPVQRKPVQSDSEDDEMRMGSQLPKLVPINDELVEGRMKKNASWSGSEEDERDMRMGDELVGGWMKGKKSVQRKPVRSDSEEDMYMGSQLPKLVPINDDDMHMGSQLPKLVPINDALVEGWMKGKKPVQRKPVRYDDEERISSRLDHSWVDEEPPLDHFL